jgi:hypothetical protein
MNKTMLFEVLQSMQAVELRELERFIQSPLFNQQPRHYLLFRYLTDCVRGSVQPDPQAAYAVLFPDTPYKDAALRMSVSALLALVEQFLAWQELSSVPLQRKTALVAAYRKRGLSKHFHIALREARADLEANPWREAQYFRQAHYLHWEQYQADAAAHRMQELNLQEVSDTLDTAFIIHKLQVACLALSHQAVFNTQYRIDLLEAVCAEADQQLHQPVVALYRYCYGFLQDKSAAFDYFSAFRQLLETAGSVLPPEEQRTLYLLAINFGIKRINTASEGWLEATFSLYKNALELGLLLENGQLSRFAFNNIVAIALRLGEANWTSVFIQQYKPYIERQYREATSDLSMARVAFFKKDYKTALLHLQRADYKDTMNNLTAKTLQLKIFYETGEWDLLDSHLSSMQAFIKRHFAIGYHRTNYSRIIAYTRQMMQNEAGAAAALLQQIEQDPILTEKEWFREQLLT